MKLFLSWSGQQSRAAAEAMQDWLPFVLNTVEPWMSASDIEAGARWSNAIQAELEETRFGIVFITRLNLAAPWLLFEAGALAKTIEDTYLCPYLLGLKPADLPSGPLSQFQAKVADRSGTWQLLQSINRALKGESIPEGRLEKAFLKWWPELEHSLSTLPPESPREATPRPADEMIEEILTIIRRIDHRGSLGGEFEVQEDVLSLPDPEFNPDVLTSRQLEVLRLMLKGQLNKQIAGTLCISVTTVKAHRGEIMKKLGVHSLAELVRRAVEVGFDPSIS